MFMLIVYDKTKIHNSYMEVSVGESVYLKCEEEAIEVRWYHKGVTVTLARGYFNHEMRTGIPHHTEKVASVPGPVIRNIELNQGGDYYCYGQYHNSSKKYLSKLTLHIYGLSS